MEDINRMTSLRNTNVNENPRSATVMKAHEFCNEFMQGHDGPRDNLISQKFLTCLRVFKMNFELHAVAITYFTILKTTEDGDMLSVCWTLGELRSLEKLPADKV